MSNEVYHNDDDPKSYEEARGNEIRWTSLNEQLRSDLTSRSRVHEKQQTENPVREIFGKCLDSEFTAVFVWRGGE